MLTKLPLGRKCTEYTVLVIPTPTYSHRFTHKDSIALAASHVLARILYV